MKKKEEKIGLTPISLILSILGILICASFIILPPLFRVILKEKVVEEKIPEKVVIETMACERSKYTVDNHTENNVITMTYAKDALRTYKKRTEQSYKNTVAYETELQNQARLSTAYSLLNGVTYNVSPKSSEGILIIEEEYDLGIFKGEKVTLPDSEEVIEIKDVYKSGDSITGIVSGLTTQGYNCKKTEEKEID